MSSTPSVFDYSPDDVPWQGKLVRDILKNFDYKLGTHEVLLSGSVGSGKSLPAAHLAVRHCMEFDKSRVLIGRKALPDLKDTIFKKILEHLECDELVQNRDYFVNESRAQIYFRNGSEIISRSWSDRKYKKLGSIEVSAAIIEEGSENDDEDEQAYDYIKMRVGRLPHVPHKWIITCTNPDSPSHWLYRRLIQPSSPTIHVYYSLLRDNKFLPPEYETGLRSEMDPKLARRMLDGEWLDIRGEVIYHAYSEANFLKKNYEIDHRYPIRLTWDFNIGEGKPLSVTVAQIKENQAHFFAEVIVQGMRTDDSLFELRDRGILNHPCKYVVSMDASGRARDTRSKMSDFDIIQKFLANFKQPSGQFINYVMNVPPSNPPVRTRHNTVNAWCMNANGERRLWVYQTAPTIDKALRMTKLKSGGQYIEDDSKDFQHCGVTVGYCIHTYLREQNILPISQFAR